jgi:hypothetical protein
MKLIAPTEENPKISLRKRRFLLTCKSYSLDYQSLYINGCEEQSISVATPVRILKPQDLIPDDPKNQV